LVGYRFDTYPEFSYSFYSSTLAITLHSKPCRLAFL
jgi:hypothetical protein